MSFADSSFPRVQELGQRQSAIKAILDAAAHDTTSLDTLLKNITDDAGDAVFPDGYSTSETDFQRVYESRPQFMEAAFVFYENEFKTYIDGAAGGGGGGGGGGASPLIFGHMREEFTFAGGLTFAGGSIPIPNTALSITDANFPSNSILTIDAALKFRVNAGGGPASVLVSVGLDMGSLPSVTLGRSYDASGVSEHVFGARFQVMRDNADKIRRMGHIIGFDNNVGAVYNLFDDLGSPIPTLPARPFNTELTWFVGYGSDDVSIALYMMAARVSSLAGGGIAS